MRTSVQVAVFLVGFALFSATVKRELRSAASGGTTLRIHQEAPAFTLPDTRGEPVELRAVAKSHKVVLVNFWATWCGPCRIELPQFAKLYQEKSARGLAARLGHRGSLPQHDRRAAIGGGVRRTERRRQDDDHLRHARHPEAHARRNHPLRRARRQPRRAAAPRVPLRDLLHLSVSHG